MYKTILAILTPAQKKRIIFLIFLSVIISCIETVGISAILPFITLANDLSLAQSNEYYNYVYKLLAFSSEKKFVVTFGLVLVGFYVSRGFINLGYTYMIQNFSQGFFRSAATKLFSNYMHIKYQDMLKRNTADLTKNLVSEAQYAGVFFYSLLLFISEILLAFFLYATLLLVEFKITVALTFFLGGMVFFLVKIISSLIKKEGVKRNEFQKEFYRIINESFGNLKFIKLLSCEQSAIENLDRTGKGFARTMVMNITYNTAQRLSLDCIGFSLLIIAFVCALHYDMQIQQILPILSLYALALYRMLPSMNRMLMSYNNMLYYAKSLELINADYNIDTHKLGAEPLEYTSEISLHGLGFKYNEEEVLTNINFRIRKSEKIAFIGESGAGKSTLADILIGMYTSFSGTMQVDGTELTEKNMLSWRKKIGYIPQSVYLFDSTVADNVTFGREYDEAALREALDKAELTTFIENNQGLDTLVGENGAYLSGGQKQRIAIARAIYGDPDMLVLDEATSALDKDTEERIMQHIFKVSEGRTLLIIAHRLSTIERCDKVYRIENRRISLVKDQQTLKE